MNSFLFGTLLGESIFISVVIGIIRFRIFPKEYYPFLFFVWLAALNDVLSIVLAYTIRNTNVNSNIYILLELWLLLWVFYRWSSTQKPLWYYILAVAGLVVWTLDNVILHSIIYINSVYRVFYSFVIIFFSINQINYVIFNTKKTVWKNARFLICIGFVIYYSYKIFLESLYIFHAKLSSSFFDNVFTILIFVNLFANLIYAIALLCIPKKHEFTLPSS